MKKAVTILTMTFCLISNFAQGNNHTVTITNSITKKMITYHKFGAHVPKPFEIFIDGKALATNEQRTIPLNDDTIKITYAFKFGSHRNGAKEVTFKIPQTVKDTALTFSWKDKLRLNLSGAKPISDTTIPYTASKKKA